MNYNTDGFNERHNYICNANDQNRLNKMGPSNLDSSVVKMKIDENKPTIETVNNDKKILKEEARGVRENFVLRNYNILNANRKPLENKTISNALSRNPFSKF